MNKNASTENVTDQNPHADDLRTLSQIGDIGMAAGDWRNLLEHAYHLGRIRGRMEGVEQALERIGTEASETA